MLSRENEIPLYLQLAKTLKKQIKLELNPGDKLPSEKEICDLYSVSRTTVRLAMEELEKSGYIYRLQGKGSFVSSLKAKIVNSFEVIDDKSLLNSVKKNSYEFKESLYGITQILPNKLHEIYSTMEFLRLQYIVLLEKAPIYIIDYYLNIKKIKNVTKELLDRKTIDEICKQENVNFKRVDEEYTIINSYHELGEKLDIELGTPILRVDKSYYSDTNELLLLVVKHVNTQKYKYQNFLEIK